MNMTSPYPHRYTLRGLNRRRIFLNHFFLGERGKYLTKGPENILPEDLDEALSPTRAVAAPAILRRAVQVAQVYGVRADARIAGGVRLEAVRERFRIRLDHVLNQAGAERITVQIAYNSRPQFKVVAERVEGTYEPRQTRDFHAGDWQGAFFNAFPINAARRPFGQS